MKKILQFALIVILICAMFQAVVDGSTAASSQSGTSTSSTTLLAQEPNTYVLTCVGLKGMNCATPNVGWHT